METLFFKTSLLNFHAKYLIKIKKAPPPPLLVARPLRNFFLVLPERKLLYLLKYMSELMELDPWNLDRLASRSPCIKIY